MPSSVNNVVGNTTVGANYLKAKPSTRFSTRDLSFLVIDMDNNSYFNNYEDPNSNFAKVIRAVQLQAEIYAVGTPHSGVVTIVVAIDTANDGDNISLTPGNPAQYNDMAFTITQALQNVGINPDSVDFKKLYGGTLTNQDITLWSTDGSTVG